MKSKGWESNWEVDAENNFIGDMQIIPRDDIKEHVLSTTCECQPTVEFVNGYMMTIHNSFDGREFEEQIEKLLSE